MGKNKAVFLDRDGVINKEINYLHTIEDFCFIDGVFESLKSFQSAGYRLIIVTNQAGIARGYYTEEQFHKLNSWMLDKFSKNGVHIDAVYYCPYHPVYGVGKYLCDSYDRKPNPGMIIKACNRFDVDPEKSVVVGDKKSDLQAGEAAGIRRLILVRSGHQFDEANTQATMIANSIKDITPNTIDAL